jgi:hypothetical protein
LKEFYQLLCINNREEVRKENMKKILTIITVFALTIVLGQELMGNALAYRGDPAKLGPNCTQEQHNAVQKALETNNYNEWKKLMAGRPIADKITEGNFAKYAKMHKLMLQGKYDEANKIKAELGLGQGQKLGKGYGKHIQK